MSTTDAPRETVDEFRARARQWLREHMSPLLVVPKMRESADWERERMLQRTLWDGGFAGICFPAEYGGLGLPIEYQQAFTEEAVQYELPFHVALPMLAILAPVLLEFGTPEQIGRYLPGMLRGDHLWVQLLSEPTGGSDLAGCITRASADGETWILSGSKIWSSGAHAADYAMCLARTDWDVPKHAGLTMFIVDLHDPRITIEPIDLANGVKAFCQEFLDDVELPSDAPIGEVGDGWTVASAMLRYERDAAGGVSPYISGHNPAAPGQTTSNNTAAELARALDVDREPVVRQLIGEHRMLDIVQRALLERVSTGIDTGAMPATAGALLRLMAADAHVRKDEIAMTIAGEAGVVWSSGDRGAAVTDAYVIRQADALAGGSTEIQRNIISERVLGLPREAAADRGVPYREVRRGG